MVLTSMKQAGQHRSQTTGNLVHQTKAFTHVLQVDEFCRVRQLCDQGFESTQLYKLVRRDDFGDLASFHR